MLNKERLIERLSRAVAWGQDHDEDFYDCLMEALNATDEELAALGLVYDYNGNEVKKLVRLQARNKITLNTESFQEFFGSLIAWGQDHDEDFYDCLMDVLGLTDEELAELGLVYDYNGDEIESLVRLQKKLEKKQNKKGDK